MIVGKYAIAILCVLGLVACAGARQPRPSKSPARWTRPCAMPGGWSFGGACTVRTVTPSGVTLRLTGYDTWVTATYGKSDAKGVRFVFGDATGRGDIAGKLGGRLAFPTFGTVPCLDPDGASAQCQGRARLYLLVINAGTVPVKFEASPRITAIMAGALLGTQRCALYTLTSAGSARQGVGWMRHAYALPTVHRVEFKSQPVPQDYKGSGAFTVFAITCA